MIHGWETARFKAGVTYWRRDNQKKRVARRLGVSVEEYQTERNARIHWLWMNGWTKAQIARKFRLSRDRVAQIIFKLEQSPRLRRYRERHQAACQ